MGKCMRKDKVTGDVALMSPSPPPSAIGVRTRAKTLALQRLHAPPSSTPPDSCYLELRSRRLVKSPPPPPPTQTQNSRKARQTCVCRGKQNRNTETSKYGESAKIASIPAAADDVEACFEETAMECEARERGRGRRRRENVPCSVIRGTARAGSNAGVVPTPPELEEMFEREERIQQHHFIEKYNFDIVSDSPLPGRYEWVTMVRP
ncbi:cyclin-dependent kinase inhibitor 4-like [Andrographis paniculata]|uniref:cyclin-dependent kinase inhibitor 4-like n=1 Tax=Andrographis paniculata TaxID=175694 RepID=UPI0021E88B2E|nr:cyclin-dependent kinase inhibitor 4-like [Andrographis paniculata]